MASESTRWSSQSSVPNHQTESARISFEKLKPLAPDFFLRSTQEVARNLLGKALVRILDGETLAAEIVEVEAYLGDNDPASHAFKGPTRRNASMFEWGGTCYVYLSYGMHYCMNVVAGPKGVGEGVLLRALAPLQGEPTMRRLRKLRANNRFGITNGPGKLTQAFSIDLAFNGVRFDREDFKLVDFGRGVRENEVARSPRIGISKAKDSLLRYCVKSSPWLSR